MVWAESVPRSWRERVRRYRLVGGKCGSCSRVVYPHRRVCPYCGSEGLEPVELPRRGKVVTYAVIRHPPRGFEGKEPYVIAVVELEGGAKVLAQLTDVKPEDVKVGMEVEAVFRRYRELSHDGVIEYGVKFRPAA
ncbi:MAG: Zn-ribbon domain-containing OB-fold protein [Infirmifilum sp.]